MKNPIFNILVSIKKKIGSYIFVSRTKYLNNTISKNIRDCSTILDLGCGYHSPLLDCDVKGKTVIGMDACDDYLSKAQSNPDKRHHQYIHSNVMDVDKFFKPKSVDCVILLDLIEHLKEEDAKTLMEKIERIAVKRIIIHTPNGFVAQEPFENNPYQRHLSGFDVKFFKQAGFKVYGMFGLKHLRKEYGNFRYKPEIISNVLSEFTQHFTFHNPELAFEILAIKNIDEK